MDRLFNLIHSLDASEKKFFKQYSERAIQQDADYIQLFDAINELKHWNEELLKKKFPDRNQTFSKLKRYLYDAILKAMSAYHAEQDERAQLYRAFVQIQFLHKKALYEDALELIHSSQEIALSNDYLIEQLWLISHEILVVNAMSDKAGLKDAVKSLYPKAKKLIASIDNWFAYRTLYGVYKTNPNLLINPSFLHEEMSATEAESLLGNEKTPISNAAKRIFYELNYLRSKAKFQVSNQIYCLQKLIGVYSQSKVSDYQTQSVLSAYTYNLILAFHENNDEDNAKNTLADLQKLKVQGIRNINRHADRLFYASLLVEMKWGQAPESERLIAEYMSAYAIGENERVSDTASLLTSYVLILLYRMKTCSWSKALDIQNLLSCHKQLPKLFPDVSGFLRISNLIIHYELGNLDLCSNLIRQLEYSNQRHLSKNTLSGQVNRGIKQLLKSSISEKRKLMTEIERCIQQDSTHPSDYSFQVLLRQTGWPKR